MSHTAEAAVHALLERAPRFAKQLVGHLGRHHGGQWSTEEGTGSIQFERGRAAVTATQERIDFAVAADDDDVLAELIDILERHLARFASEPGLRLEISTDAE